MKFANVFIDGLLYIAATWSTSRPSKVLLDRLGTYLIFPPTIPMKDPRGRSKGTVFT